MVKRKEIFLVFTVFLLFIGIVSFIPKYSELSYKNQEDFENPNFSASLEGAENILITKLGRDAIFNLYGLASFEDTLTVKNLNNNPITSILIGIPHDYIKDLIFFEATGVNKNTLMADLSDLVMKDSFNNEFNMIIIYFESPLLPQQEKTIKFIQSYTNLLSFQYAGDTQNIIFKSYVYPFVPYKSKGEIIANFSIPQVARIVDYDWGEAYSPPNENTIYFDFDDMKGIIGDNFIEPFLENIGIIKNITINFAYDNPTITKIEAQELTREIFISPWGIIKVKEEFLIENLGAIPLYTLSIKIPVSAKNVYIFDDLGEILGSRIEKDYFDLEHDNLNIRLWENRIILVPNSKFRFSIQYYLPFEKYTSFNWLQESIKIDLLTSTYEFLCREQTIKITIDGCARINSISEPPNAIEKSHGATVIIYEDDYVSPLEKKEILITYTIDLFDLLLRPIGFMLLIAIVASIFALIVKTRKRKSELTATKKEIIPLNEIREFCSLYEEKNALSLEIRQAEEDARRKKLAKKAYKNLLSKNNAKIEEIQTEIIPFKKILIETNEIFENIVKKLDVLEAERMSVKDSLNLLESRYKRGRLPSRAAYLKLSDDFKKRRKKIDRTIDKFIQQLRSYLL